MNDWRLWLGGAIAAAVLSVVLFGLALGVERYAESEAARVGKVQR
jgi:hypothetical protein